MWKLTKVAVVGAGPSGMFAAWAAVQYGCDVKLFDRDPSIISAGTSHGVFGLWDSCDLFLSQKQYVKCGAIGAKGLKADEVNEAYALKVYQDSSITASIAKYTSSEILECYNHAEAYQQILEIVGTERIFQYQVESLQDVLNLLDTYEVVINTLPAPLLFPQYVWPKKTAFIYHANAPEDESFMIYNVNDHIPWYRCSAIFGKFSMEYAQKPDNGKKHIQVTKVLPPPVDPNDLVPKEIWCVGRFGGWNKEVITEDAYWEVCRRFSDFHSIRPSRQDIQFTAASAV